MHTTHIHTDPNKIYSLDDDKKEKQQERSSSRTIRASRKPNTV
jgi:hypothetical protein